MDNNYAIYKPFGYLSQFVNNEPKGYKKKLLGELSDFPKGTMAIGRLDEKSEGLLLLTTNGKVCNQICSGDTEKEYYVQLDGVITDEALTMLQQGIKINVEGKIHITKPCEVKLLQIPPKLPERSKKVRDDRHGPTSWISITLKEGKFRQVRKMTAAVGFPTLRLIRVRIGNECLGSMKVGEVRKIGKFKIDLNSNL